MKKRKIKKKQGLFFRFFKNCMKLFIKKSEFIYLGEKIDKRAIILSNHVGTSAPLAWELYGDPKVTFWGAHEMNSGLVKLYKYQTKVYYHEKKHWNLFGARMFCLIASPLTNMFYKGLNLISTYPDARFKKTLNESIEALDHDENIVIFPENSAKGYLDELEGFHKGFTMLINICLKKNLDLPIYISYYKKKEKKYIVDAPIMISELVTKYSSREEMCKALCDRCNELGKMTFESPTISEENVTNNI